MNISPDPLYCDSHFAQPTHIISKASSFSSKTSLERISHSTWAKKVAKYDNIRQKPIQFRQIFDDRANRIPKNIDNLSKKSLNTQYMQLGETYHGKKNPTDFERRHNIKQKSQYRSHFAINRNRLYHDLHKTESNSGILVQKLENEKNRQNQGNNLKINPRYFLKTLRIKNTANIFNANFSKFTRRDIIETIKNKHLNTTLTEHISSPSKLPIFN